MGLKTILKISKNELFHFTNEVLDDLYCLNLFFINEADCKKSTEVLQNEFQTEIVGKGFYYNNHVYKLLIKGLTKEEGNTLHGFTSYSFEGNYIRAYWNNDKKELIFYKKLS